MAALQVKQAGMYLELADLPKIINTKLDQGQRRRYTYSNFIFSQVLIYIFRNTWCLNLLRNIMMEKCSPRTFSIPKAKTIAQIRPDDQKKGKRKTQSQRQ